jgi:hypothetical protein
MLSGLTQILHVNSILAILPTMLSVYVALATALIAAKPVV